MGCEGCRRKRRGEPEATAPLTVRVVQERTSSTLLGVLSLGVIGALVWQIARPVPPRI